MQAKDRNDSAASKSPSRDHLDALLDEALVETFPASDPVSIAVEEPSPPREDTGTRTTS